MTTVLANGIVRPIYIVIAGLPSPVLHLSAAIGGGG